MKEILRYCQDSAQRTLTPFASGIQQMWARCPIGHSFVTTSRCKPHRPWGSCAIYLVQRSSAFPELWEILRAANAAVVFDVFSSKVPTLPKQVQLH